jgi:hypothetical protein
MKFAGTPQLKSKPAPVISGPQNPNRSGRRVLLGVQLVGTQPLPGMYSRLPEGVEAQPHATRTAANRSSRKTFDIGFIPKILKVGSAPVAARV